MRGRKPKPTHLKLLEGNPGHRPINGAEPKPSLVTKARAGNVTAMIFFLKTQGGWRETLEVATPPAAPESMIDLTQLSDETLHELMAVLGRSQAAETIELEKDRANDRWSIS